MADITIIIPTYNRNTALEMTLIGFTKQSYQIFDIIIVNDGGNKNTEEIIKKYEKKLDIQYVYQKNMGRSSARNTALKYAKGRYIIFNDDDRIPDENYVKAHLELLKSNSNQVNVGHKRDILGIYDSNLPQIGKIRTKMAELGISEIEQGFFVEDLEKEFSATLRKWCLGDSEDNISIADDYVYRDIENFKLGWMFATTANMSYDRLGLEDVLFDTDYKGWGIEDNDFAYQLYRRKKNIRYADNAVNYHLIHLKSGNFIKEMKLNLNRMCKKYEDLQVYFFKLYLEDIIYLDEVQDIYNCFAKDISKNIMLKILKDLVS